MELGWNGGGTLTYTKWELGPTDATQKLIEPGLRSEVEFRCPFILECSWVAVMPAAANRVPDTNPAAADQPLPAAKPIHFGAFEVDLRAGELHKDGLKIKLQGQPIQVLVALLEHPGEIVTREQLRHRLWPSSTFVDFEHNLNSAVKRLREAVGDSADNPRFIETIPRHGYRFIAPVAEQARPVHQPQFRIRELWIAVLALVMMVALVIGLNMGGLRQRLFSRAPGAPIQSLAVLPLENLSGSPEDEYFADGMTEELITELGRIRALRVISRQSVIQYKGTDKPLPQIASELHVEALVQGSALRAGGRVRITTQLIRAVPEEHLWAQSYERDLRDVIALQGEVARDIANQIRVTLTPAEQAHRARARPANIEAYNAYLQAQYFYARPTEENLKRTIAYSEQAISLDPGYAPAWAILSKARNFQAFAYGPVEYSRAREAAERALALDPSLADAHAAIGHIKQYYDWDWAGAEASYQRALALEPGDAEVLEEAGSLAATLNHFEEALALSRRAVELDPLRASAYRNLANVAEWAGQLDEAEAAARKGLELDPQFPWLHTLLAFVQLARLRPQEVLAEAERDMDPLFRLEELALAYHALGRKQESDRALAEMIAKFHADAAYQIAQVYAFRGEADTAFTWLERAYEQRDPGLSFIKGDRLLKTLERDPRYAAFLKKMHLPA
jgi:TolB-like protein/DNA-binding winged helix-turn-helix (wHTH) protein